MRPDLGGRRYLVTGAGGGLGSRVAGALAECGAVVFATDLRATGREPDGAAPAGRGRIVPILMDVTRRESVGRFREIIGQGGLDGVVCAAGIFSAGALIEMHEEEVLRCFDVNVMGAFRVVRELFPLLAERRGRVVLVSSETSWPIMPFTGPYTMSKCALEAFAHTLRREVSVLGVVVSVIRPGALRTPFLDSAGAALSRAGSSSSFAAAFAKASRLLGRERQTAMDPGRVASLVVHELFRRRQRPVSRVGNDPLRVILGLLPHSAADWLIRRFLMLRPRT